MSLSLRMLSLRVLLTLGVTALLVTSAQAHFIWLVPTGSEGEQQTVSIYFGESAEDDDPSYLGLVKKAEVRKIAPQGKPVVLPSKMTDDALLVTDVNPRTSGVYATTFDLGTRTKGESSFRLIYHAKTGPALGSALWSVVDTTSHIKLDVVPKATEKGIALRVFWEGQPLPQASVTAYGPGIEEFDQPTDESGRTVIPTTESGLFSVRVKHVLPATGDTGSETRHYTTLTLSVPETNATTMRSSFPTLPHPVTSFGAATIDNAVYVYGGHIGDPHSYSIEEQSNSLYRLPLGSEEGWEKLAEGPRLQGLAMVAHEGTLYRLGGFTAKNKADEDSDLWSQNDAESFDLQSKKWVALPNLPEPRSSFDAAVLGDAIYVVGGWQMAGEAEAIWHKTAWKLDLSQAPESRSWQKIENPPFQRRALALAAHDGKIYAVGGMQENGEPTKQVTIYDPASNTWSEAPSLLGERGLSGFGSSAFGVGGRLYVSTIDGNLQRLSEDGARWEIVKTFETARFFHRMLPTGEDTLLMIGGADMRVGKHDDMEAVIVPQPLTASE